MLRDRNATERAVPVLGHAVPIGDALLVKNMSASQRQAFLVDERLQADCARTSAAQHRKMGTERREQLRVQGQDDPLCGSGAAVRERARAAAPSAWRPASPRHLFTVHPALMGAFPPEPHVEQRQQRDCRAAYENEKSRR